MWLSALMLADEVVMEEQFMRWKELWKGTKPLNRPTNVTEALKIATNLGTYPCISNLLRIFATLPVTTATTERSFSALKRSKSYLCSTMNDKRLKGLAHLNINRDYELCYDLVIDEFSKTNRRRDFSK